MEVSALLVSAIIVEFLTICSVNLLQTGKSIYEWYKKFGVVAVVSDTTSIMIGIMIANYFVPNASLLTLLIASIIVQVIHDVLFYVLVIRPIPQGTNSVIDIFKNYASENSYTILFADALIIGLTVLLYSVLKHESQNLLAFLGIVGVYATTYIMYTNR
jgi:uncharacterized protein YacL